MVFFFEKLTDSGVEKTASQLPHVRSVASIILEKQVDECRKIKEEFEKGGRTPPKVILKLQIVVDGDIYEGMVDSSLC